MQKIPTYILAGGKSSRFGSDKARARYEGLPLISHIKNILSPIATSIKAITDAEYKYDDLEIDSVVDIFPNMGPIGGIYTALMNMPADNWCLIVQCDIAGLKLEWIDMLHFKANEYYQAVVFKDRQYWQAIPGLYHTRAITEIKKQLDMKQLKLSRLIDSLKVQSVALPENWADSKDINSKQDLTTFCNRR